MSTTDVLKFHDGIDFNAAILIYAKWESVPYV